MFDTVRLITSNEQTSEIRIFQNTTETGYTLFENFFPVCHEQKPGTSAELFAVIPVIERRNNGFPVPVAATIRFL